MTMIKATIRNGRIEHQERVPLPDGTEFMIPLPNGKLKDVMPGEEDWEDTPEAIEKWIADFQAIPPLKFTPDELKALEADRLARKEWEKAHFFEEAERLRKMWE